MRVLRDPAQSRYFRAVPVSLISLTGQLAQLARPARPQLAVKAIVPHLLRLSPRYQCACDSADT